MKQTASRGRETAREVNTERNRNSHTCHVHDWPKHSIPASRMSTARVPFVSRIGSVELAGGFSCEPSCHAG